METSLEQSLSMAMDILSYPCAFLLFRLLIMLSIESADNCMSGIEGVCGTRGGRELSISKGRHWRAKYSLKIFAFFLKLEIKTPFSNKGRIFVIFFLLDSRLKAV